MWKRFTLVFGCLAMLFLAVGAKADAWNKKTTVTFSQPVELPGIVLPAGTYVFKLADLAGTRNVLQVFNQDENQILATILAITDIHLTPRDKTYIGFEERRADLPPAIHEWFYPGDTFGLEFVYPKARAQELARETGKPVLAAEVKPAETPAELEREAVAEVEPENAEVEYTIAPQSVPDVALPFTPNAEPPALVLPETAGSVPMLAIAGLLCLAGAGAMKFIDARTGK